MSSFPLLVLAIIFLSSAVAVWVAGIKLSTATDILSVRLGLGEALGGMILLAIVTNLPEIAITVSAAFAHNMELAIGNILGGIAMQTVVLVYLDVFGLRKEDPLTFRAASLVIVLEGALVIVVLTLVVIGNQFATTFSPAWLAPVEFSIAISWVIGILLVGKARTSLPWHEQGTPLDGQKKPRGHSKIKKHEDAIKKGITTRKVVIQFLFCSLVTLLAGVALEVTSDEIAARLGMDGLLFGATILAAATSLPELSTGMESIKLHDYQMAFSDIFGGNAFLPVLFLVAVFISGDPVLPKAQKADIYLTGVGMLLTVVYMFGLIFRPKKQIFRMGVDSFIVLVIYILAVIGLFAIPSIP